MRPPAVAFFRRGPAPARRSVSRTDQPSAAACFASRVRFVLLGDLEDRPAVSLGQLAPLEQGQHRVGQVEQPDQVGDRGAAAADAAGELLLRDAEVVDQGGAGPGLLDRVEVLADHVLDQRRLQPLVLR